MGQSVKGLKGLLARDIGVPHISGSGLRETHRWFSVLVSEIPRYKLVVTIKG